MASDTASTPGPCADVAVVILNWNGRRWLEKFLPTVLAHADGATVVVADNASTDDSVELVGRAFPRVQLIQNATNLGFCEGYNQALEVLHTTAAFRYYVLLNSDVEVTANWLPPLRALLEQQPSVAAVQPKIRQYSADVVERAQFEYAGAGGGYLDRLGYPFCRGRLFDTLETDRGQYDDSRPVAWATGACLLVRATAWHAMDGLDTAYFAHMEEIDLCWRLWNAGHEVWYYGGSTVFHVGGGTLAKSNPHKTYLNFRNGLALVYKNSTAAELPGVLVQRLLLDWVAALRLLTQGQVADCRAVLRAHWYVARHVRGWQQRRRQFPPRLRIDERPGVYLGSLVWAYFAKGKRAFPALSRKLFNKA
ncbi:glycosyltransferase family 2 protein [Hymenobacter defluvii]|uniref:glycosyltransferase family 2 protein n=1 Tax=Hymenobacter defluvii TaxID=2054411 RepID=UPI001FB8A596|nr:glycosyltransferase family 2 protein [Hymenobacter defluvii]